VSAEPTEARARVTLAHSSTLGELESPAPPRAPGVVGILAALLGLGLGSSGAWGGLYDISLWGPLTLLVLALLLGFITGRRLPLARPPRLALGGLIALAALSLLSASWAESSDAAFVEAHRWALYAALFTLALYLARGPRAAHLLVGAASVGVVIAGLVTAGRLVGEETVLFFNGRLSEPLGYVNGNAAFFALGIYPTLIAAERARSAGLRALAAGSAALLLCLVFLVQSRGATFGLIAGAVVIMAAFPGRLRRAWLLVVVGVSVAVVSPTLVGVNGGLVGPLQLPPAGRVGEVGWATVSAAVLAGVLWLTAELIYARVGLLPTGVARVRQAGVALAVVVTLASLGVAVAEAPAISAWAQRQWHAFNTDKVLGPSSARLFSGAGNRYDYWRVALSEFRAHPGVGLGAGNYETDYLRQRHTAEDIRQPHSIELQAMAELGILGAVALGLFMVGACWILVQGARGPAPSGLVVAVTGLFVTWLVHTSVDWLHLLPGLTGVTLCGLAAVAVSHTVTGRRPLDGLDEAGRLYDRRHLATLAVGALGILVAAVGVGRLTLASHYRSQAGDALAAGRPQKAISRARSALALEPGLLPAIYLDAAALARLDRYDAARRELGSAVRSEPHNPVPHALLGDLAVRRGDLRQASRDYREAATLDPQNLGLHVLAMNPRAALGGAGP